WIERQPTELGPVGVRVSPGAPFFAWVAQLVERLPEEQGVVGSIPASSTIFIGYRGRCWRSPVRIIVNGQKREIESPVLSYRDIVLMVGGNPEHVYTVVYSHVGSDNGAGSVIKGQTVS